MNQTVKRIVYAITAILALLGSFFVLLSGTVAAEAATITLTAEKEFTPQTAVIVVEIHAGDAKITAAQVCLTYDHNKLSASVPDYNNTPLASTTPKDPSTDCNGQSVQLGRYGLTDHPTGTFVLGRVTFASITKDTGETAINIDRSKSFVYSDAPGGENIISTVTGTSLPLNAPSDSSGTYSTPAPNEKNGLNIIAGIIIFVVVLVLVAALIFLIRIVRNRNNGSPTE